MMLVLNDMDDIELEVVTLPSFVSPYPCPHRTFLKILVGTLAIHIERIEP
jgi:hypothetical protein